MDFVDRCHLLSGSAFIIPIATCRLQCRGERQRVRSQRRAADGRHAVAIVVVPADGPTDPPVILKNHIRMHLLAASRQLQAR